MPEASNLVDGKLHCRCVNRLKCLIYCVIVVWDGHDSIGARLAGVLYPRTDWGQRVAAAFSSEWTELGGLISTETSYADDASSAPRPSPVRNTARTSENA